MAGGLYYATQTTFQLIGTISGTTRTAIEIENTYQAESTTEATKTFDTGGYTRVDFNILYTMGGSETANSIQVILETTIDGTNFYRLPNDSTSGATSTITEREFTYLGTTDGGNSELTLGVDIAYKAMRISIKESGVSSNKGSVYVEALLSGR